MNSINSTNAMLYAKNYTLGEKGADSWKSTLEPLLDLFATSIKRCPESFEEFEKIFQIVSHSLKHNPQGFIQLLKFHRLIKNGNGIKWLYYLCLLVLKIENPVLYEQVLEWSWQYPKDLLTLHRFTNLYEPTKSSTNVQIDFCVSTQFSNKGSLGLKTKAFQKHNLSNIISNQLELQFEIVLYTNYVFKTIKNLITPGFTGDINPMFLKYMSWETGHWALESKLIWDYLEELVKNDSDFINLLNQTEQLETTLGSELKEILKKSFEKISSNQFGYSNIFTNKTRRLIKKCFNSHINLLDNLFKGIHQDDSIFGSLGSEEEEINLICNQIKKSATLAYARFEKTVKRYIYKQKLEYKLEKKNNHHHLDDNIEIYEEYIEDDENLVKKYLVKGLEKYYELLKNGKAQSKTTGLDASTQVWDFFTGTESFDQSVESKLIELSNQLKESLVKITGDELFNEMAEKFSLVLDISGSMRGIPIETGLLYMVLMTRVFGIKRLYYFESNLSILDLTEQDLSETMCYLVKKIYRYTTGSTNLESVFENFINEKITGKNVIIITDGDCDPNMHRILTNKSSNPFHSAPKSSQNLKYVVVNVKETKMNFPYLGLDPDVCYVSGNNPKTLVGLFKALIKSINENICLTPTLVLTCSLDLDELSNEFEVGTFSKEFTQSEIEKIHQIFMINLAPKNLHTIQPINHIDIMNYSSDSNADSDSCYDSDCN